jgi:zinc protease
MSGKAEQIGFYEIVLGDPAAAVRRLEGYRRAPASDLRKAARRYLSGGGRTLIRVVPDPGQDAPADAAGTEAAE